MFPNAKQVWVSSRRAYQSTPPIATANAVSSHYQLTLDRLRDELAVCNQLRALLCALAELLDLVKEVTASTLDWQFCQRLGGIGGGIGQRAGGSCAL